MIRRPTRSTQAFTLFPYTTLFRSTTASARSPQRGDDLVDRRGTSLREGDGPVPLHSVHRALDAVSVVLERVVCAGDHPVGIRQQREVEAQFGRILGMTVRSEERRVGKECE